MQLSIEAIVFHRGDGRVEVRNFNLLDRARFGTIPQLGELYERRLRRFKTVRKLRSGPCATRKKRSPSPSLPRRTGPGPPPLSRRAPSGRLSYLTPLPVIDAVCLLARVLTVPRILADDCITVSRSPAFCYATTALIHYSCTAETRLAT